MAAEDNLIADPYNVELLRFVDRLRCEPALQEALPRPADYTLRNYGIVAFDLAMIDSRAFRHIEHRRLVEWACQHFDPQLDGVPFRALDPLDLKEALGTLVILEASEDFSDFRYRLYGTRVVEAFGKDLTGKSSRTLDTESTRNVLPQYRSAALHKFAVYTEHDAVYPARFAEARAVRWARLILPLVDESGKTRRLVIGMVPTELRATARDQDTAA